MESGHDGIGTSDYARSVGSKVGNNGMCLNFMVKNQKLTLDRGGEGGIRTPGTLTRTPDFESGTFNRSATSPKNLGVAGRQ